MTLPAIPFRLPFSTPPERRSPREIDDDLDAEFAFHIEMKTRDLIEAGHAPDEAAAMARQSFGNIETIKQTCRQLALKEQLMLQRVNFVMMILVLIVLGFVGVQVYTTQRHNTLALQAITSELTKMKYAAQSANSPDSGSALADSGATARVLVEGNILNPGWHEISLDKGTTVRELLQRLNVRPNQWVSHGTGKSSRPGPLPAKHYYESTDAKILRPNDELQILDDVPPELRRSYFMNVYNSEQIPLCWTATNAEGAVFHVGHIVSRGRAQTFKSLKLIKEKSNSVIDVNLYSTPQQVGIYIPATAWDYLDGRLVLNVSDLSHDVLQLLALDADTLIFEPASDCEAFERAFRARSLALNADHIKQMNRQELQNALAELAAARQQSTLDQQSRDKLVEQNRLVMEQLRTTKD